MNYRPVLSKDVWTMTQWGDEEGIKKFCTFEQNFCSCYPAAIMFIIDPVQFAHCLKGRGYASIADLARDLGVHRNTIHYYLRERPVFSHKLQKILDALHVDPAQLIVKKAATPVALHTHEIATLIDELHAAFPQTTYILFGSRARGQARRYADWDVGVYSDEGLTHVEFRKIVRLKNELEEDSSYFIDLVNFNQADVDFLQRAAKHWMFLAGRQQDWLALQRKVKQ